LKQKTKKLKIIKKVQLNFFLRFKLKDLAENAKFLYEIIYF